jgi:hypothetical protein
LGITEEQARFIQKRDLDIAIITGRVDHIPLESINRAVIRHHNISNSRQEHLLHELYDIESESEWIHTLMMEPHPLEPILLNFEAYNVSDIIRTFGMVIPRSFENNVREYILNNIISYKDILTRGDLKNISLETLRRRNQHTIRSHFKKLTDYEIFNFLGVYIAYRSRTELVERALNSMVHNTFMMPLRRNHSVNSETIMGTPISDQTIFMIGYGTVFQYRLYEIPEFIGAFHRDSDTGALEFRHPHNLSNYYTFDDIDILINLLRSYEPTEEITLLLNRIEEGIIEARDKIAFDTTAREALRQFNSNSIDLMKQFLRQIFYTGMYMRRWLGPGHPFPLESSTTNGADPEKEVAKQIGIAMELLKSMGALERQFCMNLRVCEYNKQGGIDSGRTTFDQDWNRVVKGELCIRMASSRFVGTGYHYLRVLFKETIPNMNPRSLDRIV